jgi:hypothetical protein
MHATLRPLDTRARQAVRLMLAIGLLVALWTRNPVVADGQVTHPFAGITHIVRVETVSRPNRMHIIQIDLSAPGLRFVLTPPAGSREVVRETTAAFLTRQRAQVAINAHFFTPFPSTDTEAWVIGLATSEGHVFSAFEVPEQSYALVASAPALNIDRQNRAMIVHRDGSNPDGLHVVEPVELWTTVAGAAQIVTDGAVTIPVYRDESHPKGALTPGGPRDYSNANSWYDVVTARSAIGLSRDNRTLTMFTVDARGGSDGMRVGEVAALLAKDYGVWNALNLDGGGSTSLAMADPATGAVSLANTSSDNPAGRSVASSLAVFARAR